MNRKGTQMRQILYTFTVLILAAYVVGCGGSTTSTRYPPGATGTITGVVDIAGAGHALQLRALRSTAGVGVAGALVSVRGYPALTALSTSTGAFQIANVPIGPQQLEVSLAGYTTTNYSITVQPGINPVTLNSGTTAPSKWTVLVYMAANQTGNISLDADALLNFQQLQKFATVAGTVNPAVNILVQITRSGGNGAGTDNWSGTRRYVAQQNTSNTIFLPAELLANMGNAVDSGDPKTLQDFITWGQNTAPAEHYLVDVWDHGSGWDPDGDSLSTTSLALKRAICYDQTTGSMMTDASLSTALTAKYHIDILLMDACLMACAEVAYQIRNQADYLVASEDAVPDIGYNYADIISKLISQYSTLTPSAFAQYIAADALQYWGNTTSLSMSVLDLSKMDAIAGALNTFSQRLITLSSANSAALLTSWQQSVAFDGTAGSDMRDLSVFAKRVAANSSDTQLRSAATVLVQAIADSVVWKGGETSAAYGLSIYFPAGLTFSSNRNIIAAYQALALAQNTAWAQWLKVSPGK